MANTVSYPFGLRRSASCGKFRKSMLAWLFGISALCWLGESNRLYAQFGPPEGGDRGDRGRDRGDRGGRGGFDPSEMIRRMDQNGDGMITANEVERVPSFIRDRWTQQGLDFNRGVRVDDMANNAQRQMEEFRRQREEGGSDRGRDFGRSDRPDFQPPPDMGRGDTRPATPGTPQSTKPRTRIAPLLPETYKPLDTDFDGQIALFEWRKGKRGTISQFTQQDFDGDGFLTAKELAKAPAPAATATTTLPGAPAATTATAAPAPTTPAAPQTPVVVSAEAATKASRAFDILDSDRKGTVEGKEWDQSSRLKPLFQKAGYDLNKPLNKEEFTQAYVRVGADK